MFDDSLKPEFDAFTSTSGSENDNPCKMKVKVLRYCSKKKLSNYQRNGLFVFNMV